MKFRPENQAINNGQDKEMPTEPNDLAAYRGLTRLGNDRL